MDQHFVSLNQVNFDKQTLDDVSEDIESFANIVSYDVDFKSENSFPIISKKLTFENGNGYYIQQERNDKNHNSDIPRPTFHDDVMSNSFKAFTDTTDVLNLKETLISGTTFQDYRDSVSAEDYAESSSNHSSLNLNAKANKANIHNTTLHTFQLESEPPINKRRKKTVKEGIKIQTKAEVINEHLSTDISTLNSVNNDNSGDYNNSKEENLIVSRHVEEIFMKNNDDKTISKKDENISPNFPNKINSVDVIIRKETVTSEKQPIQGANLMNADHKKYNAETENISVTKTVHYQHSVNNILLNSEQLTSTENGFNLDSTIDQSYSNTNQSFKSWELERAHLIGRLDVLEAELRLILNERSHLRTRVANLEEQLNLFGSTTQDRDALLVDLETLRINQARLESVIMEAHGLLQDRNDEILRLMAAMMHSEEEKAKLRSEWAESRQAVESREAISIDLKAKITELYIELQLTNQNKTMVDNQVLSFEADFKAANAAKNWFKEQLDMAQNDLNELRDELTSVRAKLIQRGTELERCKAELAR